MTKENNDFHVISAEKIADQDEEILERESVYEPLASSPEGVSGFLRNKTNTYDNGRSASRNISNLISSDNNKLNSDEQLKRVFD